MEPASPAAPGPLLQLASPSSSSSPPSSSSSSSAAASAAAAAAAFSPSPGGGATSEYGERLSRKVLASLKSLNESLGEVRRSVAKIDSIANTRLSLAASAAAAASAASGSPGGGLGATTPSALTFGTPGGSSAAAGPRSPLAFPIGSALGAAAAAATGLRSPLASPTLATSAAAPSAEGGAPPAPPSTPASAAVPALPLPSLSLAAAPPSPVSMAEAAALLKRVLMSPAFKGTGVDDGILADLASVLPVEDMDEVRRHVAFRPAHDHAAALSDAAAAAAAVGLDGGRARTPGSGHSSRPHTPPPASWHTPGSGPRHSGRGASAGKSGGDKGGHGAHPAGLESAGSRHSLRSHGSVRFGGEEEIPVSPSFVAADGGGAAGPEGSIPQILLGGGDDDDEDDEDDDEDEEDVEGRNFDNTDAGAVRAAIARAVTGARSASQQAESDGEDSEDGLLLHPVQRGLGGLAAHATGGRARVGDGADSNSDSDDADGLAAAYGLPAMPSAQAAAAAAAAGVLTDARRGKGAAVVPPRLPAATPSTPSSSAAAAVSLPADHPVRVFTFTRFVDVHAEEIEDDGEDVDIPVRHAEVDEHEFYATEAEVGELGRAKEKMGAAAASPASGAGGDDAVPPSPSSPSSSSASASAAADFTGARPGRSILPPNTPLPDAFTVVDVEAAPQVEDWHGSECPWPTGEGAEAGAGEGGDGVAEGGEGGATALASPSTSSPAPSGRQPRRRQRRRFEAFALKVVYEAGRTGLEDIKEFRAAIGEVIAGRYRVLDFLGSAAFSSALSCLDLVTGDEVCLKIVKNNKDFVDQSLDEIKLLRYINAQGSADEHNVLRLRDYFYHREHLFLVTELLKDNLYEFQKYLSDGGHAPYFTLPRIQAVARQCLTALAFVHSKGLIHCDLKPENVLIRSYSRCEVKVIDFGSSCFVTDHLSTYIQSRSYRAPEIVLGLPYGTAIDVWSLGCILYELYTGKVLFANDSVQTMLARMQVSRCLGGGGGGSCVEEPRRDPVPSLTHPHPHPPRPRLPFSPRSPSLPRAVPPRQLPGVDAGARPGREELLHEPPRRHRLRAHGRRGHDVSGVVPSMGKGEGGSHSRIAYPPRAHPHPPSHPPSAAS
jgi:hypothetical protein